MPLSRSTRWIYLLVMLFLGVGLLAQNQYQQLENISFTKNGKTYANPWLGGFNTPIIATADLDGDGDQDFVIMEKGEGKVYTFRNGGTPGQVDYSFAPELSIGFPDDISNFIALKDFNCDGVEDLFSYAPMGAGIASYMGRYEAGVLHFNSYNPFLRDNQGFQIYCDATKLPAFDDINGDGDVDILIFEQSEGTIGYYENQNEENGDCDTLQFIKMTNCWGHLCECSIAGDLVKYTFETGPNNERPETFDMVGASDVSGAPVLTDEGFIYNSNCNGISWIVSGLTNGASYNPDHFIEFSVRSDTPDFSLYLTNVLFRVANADTCDPVQFELRSSHDGFTSAIGGTKTISNNCQNVQFNLQLEPFFYKVDSVKFRLYAFSSGICNPMDRDLIVDRITVQGQINRKNSFDMILDYNHPFCYFNYISGGGGGGSQEAGPDTIPGKRHTGSTLTIMDINKDGKKEVLVGDAGFDNLIFLLNDEGATGRDSIVGLDYFYPSYDKSIDMPVFPAGYYVDVNNDQKEDLLVAPFHMNNCFFNSLLDTALTEQNIWYYRNDGDASQDSFVYVTNSFLVDEMIDFGQRPKPVFFDYNRDGLQDLVIGQCHSYGIDRQLKQGLILYENVGTPTIPEYAWVTDDYLNLTQYDWYGLRPTFGDLTDDGYPEMILGLSTRGYRYFENAGILANPDSFIFQPTKLDTLQSSTDLSPQLIDVNGDAILDLLVGEYQGRTFYFRNNGTEISPSFVLEDNFYGKMDSRLGNFFGHATPFMADLDQDAQPEILVGNYWGDLILYDEIELTPPGGAFTLSDTNFLDIEFGNFLTVHGADITDDGDQELVVGTGRGGLQFYGKNPIGAGLKTLDELGYQLFPNPAHSLVRLRWQHASMPGKVSWEIMDAMGRMVKPITPANNTRTLTWDCAHMPRGIYYIRITTSMGQEVLPVILQ